MYFRYSQHFFVLWTFFYREKILNFLCKTVISINTINNFYGKNKTKTSWRNSWRNLQKRRRFWKFSLGKKNKTKRFFAHTSKEINTMFWWLIIHYYVSLLENYPVSRIVFFFNYLLRLSPNSTVSGSSLFIFGFGQTLNGKSSGI